MSKKDIYEQAKKTFRKEHVITTISGLGSFSFFGIPVLYFYFFFDGEGYEGIMTILFFYIGLSITSICLTATSYFLDRSTWRLEYAKKDFQHVVIDLGKQALKEHQGIIPPSFLDEKDVGLWLWGYKEARRTQDWK